MLQTYRLHILHAKIFLAKILWNKKLFDLNEIFGQYKTHLEIEFLKLLFESDNFLLNTIFGQNLNIGVDYMTSDSASAEVCREVGGGLSWMVN